MLSHLLFRALCRLQSLDSLIHRHMQRLGRVRLARSFLVEILKVLGIEDRRDVGGDRGRAENGLGNQIWPG